RPPSSYFYNEGPGPILFILALIAILILIALQMPEIQSSKWKVHLPPALPGDVRAATGSPEIYIAFLLAVFVVLPIWLLIKLPEPTARGKVALVAGLLLLLMASSFLGGITGNPTLLLPFVI